MMLMPMMKTIMVTVMIMTMLKKTLSTWSSAHTENCNNDDEGIEDDDSYGDEDYEDNE